MQVASVRVIGFVHLYFITRCACESALGWNKLESALNCARLKTNHMCPPALLLSLFSFSPPTAHFSFLPRLFDVLRTQTVPHRKYKNEPSRCVSLQKKKKTPSRVVCHYA